MLSTCNRTEIYYSQEPQSRFDQTELIHFLSRFCDIQISEFARYMYFYQEQKAVEHLLKVAASLDSMVIGEGQILAQVKESYALASKSKCTNKVLNRLFHCAFTTGKEIYTATSIAQRRVSIAGVAIELACQLIEKISQAKVAVIGSGDMGELLIRHLLDLNSRDITVYNRTFERAEKMAGKYQIQSRRWDELSNTIGQNDIIIAAATTQNYLFDKSFLKKRQAGPLLIIDIAVPRNFDPGVNDLDDVYLYSVDDLAAVVQQNIAIREEDRREAQKIIADNLESFMDWFGIMDVGPMIGKLREKFHDISRAELLEFLHSEKELDAAQRLKLEMASNRIVNKLLHRLISGIYQMAKEQGTDEAIKTVQDIIQTDDCLARKKINSISSQAEVDKQQERS